jgi:hypothetical protein
VRDNRRLCLCYESSEDGAGPAREDIGEAVVVAGSRRYGKEAARTYLYSTCLIIRVATGPRLELSLYERRQLAAENGSSAATLDRTYTRTTAG